jgi:hypothetical protein
VLFYSTKRFTIPDFCIFRKSITICNGIPRGANVDPNSEVCPSAMLVLPIGGNRSLTSVHIPQAWRPHHVSLKYLQQFSSLIMLTDGQTCVFSLTYAFTSCTPCKKRITRSFCNCILYPAPHSRVFVVDAVRFMTCRGMGVGGGAMTTNRWRWCGVSKWCQ